MNKKFPKISSKFSLFLTRVLPSSHYSQEVFGEISGQRKHAFNCTLLIGSFQIYFRANTISNTSIAAKLMRPEGIRYQNLPSPRIHNFAI